MLRRLRAIGGRLIPAGAPRAAKLNLGIVAVFALVAVLLLSLTLINARSIRSNVASAITPELTGVNRHLGGLPALDRTGELTGAIVVATAPIGAAVAHTRESIVSGALSTDAIRDGVHSIAGSVAEIGGSVTSITSSLRSLQPLVVVIAEQTGDISTEMTGSRKATVADFEAVARSLATVEHLAADASAVGDQVAALRLRLRRISGHTENAAAAKILQLGRRHPAPARADEPRGSPPAQSLSR